MAQPFRTRARARAAAFALLAALSGLAAAGPAYAQMVNSAATARKGLHLAAIACSTCHQVAADERRTPALAPLAPSFDAIAQRPGIDEDALAHFITTTRRGADHPSGMPNPYLLEYQVKEVVAYILSLRR
jgi:mono/diheme cytochrome c family protein